MGNTDSLQKITATLEEKRRDHHALSQRAMSEGRKEDAAFHRGIAWACTSLTVDVDEMIWAAGVDDEPTSQHDDAGLGESE